MSAKADPSDRERGKGSPAPFRQEDIERLAAGEMPHEIVTVTLEAGISPGKAAPITKRKKLAPVELTAKEIDALARGESTSEETAERLETAAKLDMNRKRAAGTRAERPDITPRPGRSEPNSEQELARFTATQSASHSNSGIGDRTRRKGAET